MNNIRPSLSFKSYSQPSLYKSSLRRSSSYILPRSPPPPPPTPPSPPPPPPLPLSSFDLNLADNEQPPLQVQLNKFDAKEFVHESWVQKKGEHFKGTQTLSNVLSGPNGLFKKRWMKLSVVSSSQSPIPQNQAPVHSVSVAKLCYYESSDVAKKTGEIQVSSIISVDTNPSPGPSKFTLNIHTDKNSGNRTYVFCCDSYNDQQLWKKGIERVLNVLALNDVIDIVNGVLDKSSGELIVSDDTIDTFKDYSKLPSSFIGLFSEFLKDKKQNETIEDYIHRTISGSKWESILLLDNLSTSPHLNDADLKYHTSLRLFTLSKHKKDSVALHRAYEMSKACAGLKNNNEAIKIYKCVMNARDIIFGDGSGVEIINFSEGSEFDKRLFSVDEDRDGNDDGDDGDDSVTGNEGETIENETSASASAPALQNAYASFELERKKLTLDKANALKELEQQIRNDNASVIEEMTRTNTQLQEDYYSALSEISLHDHTVAAILDRLTTSERLVNELKSQLVAVTKKSERERTMSGLFRRASSARSLTISETPEGDLSPASRVKSSPKSSPKNSKSNSIGSDMSDEITILRLRDEIDAQTSSRRHSREMHVEEINELHGVMSEQASKLDQLTRSRKRSTEMHEDEVLELSGIIEEGKKVDVDEDEEVLDVKMLLGDMKRLQLTHNNEQSKHVATIATLKMEIEEHVNKRRYSDKMLSGSSTKHDGEIKRLQLAHDDEQSECKAIIAMLRKETEEHESKQSCFNDQALSESSTTKVDDVSELKKTYEINMKKLKLVHIEELNKILEIDNVIANESHAVEQAGYIATIAMLRKEVEELVNNLKSSHGNNSDDVSQLKKSHNINIKTLEDELTRVIENYENMLTEERALRVNDIAKLNALHASDILIIEKKNDEFYNAFGAHDDATVDSKDKQKELITSYKDSDDMKRSEVQRLRTSGQLKIDQKDNEILQQHLKVRALESKVEQASSRRSSKTKLGEQWTCRQQLLSAEKELGKLEVERDGLLREMDKCVTS